MSTSRKSGFTLSKEDFGIVVFPFLLTAALIVLGYQILVRQTPEARLSLPPADNTVEIIRSGEFSPVSPPTTTPQTVQFVIGSLPQNSSQLTNLIDRAKTTGANAVYLSLPLTMGSDHSLKVDYIDKSSQDNVEKWLKRTTIALHQQGFHTLLALTINASTTISDYAAFEKNYLALMNSNWMDIAAAYHVSFLFPGITVGHPLYSQLTPPQMSQLVIRTNQALRQTYQAQIGIGLCCQTDPPTNYLFGYNFALVIGNQDVATSVLSPIAESLKPKHRFSHVFYYLRDSMTATSSIPQ